MPQVGERKRTRPIASGRRWRWVLPVMGLVVFAGAWSVLAGGTPTTDCVHLCPDLGDPCVVQQDVTVIPGSTIACGSRRVEVTGGSLYVHDGQFVLQAASVNLVGRTITADCPSQSATPGFTLAVSGDVTVGSQASLRASCEAGGGVVRIQADNAVTIGGLGILANGTGADAGGGTIEIRAGGPVLTTVPLEARATVTPGDAPGGQIELHGSTIAVQAALTATGIGSAGGAVVLDSGGDLTVDKPSGTTVLDVSMTDGDGGVITARADGTLTIAETLRARGIGPTSTGGSVELDGERVLVNGPITASGGETGGAVRVESRGGSLEVATGASSAVELSVEKTSNDPGDGGTMVFRSAGNDVVLGALTRLKASNPDTGSSGGTIEIAAASVVAANGAQVIADGPSGSGGEITIEARDQMNLDGTVRATNGSITLVYRNDPPNLGPNVVCPCEQVGDADLLPPCGDDVRRAGVEQCDGPDLDEQTCSSLGLPTGMLLCSPTCTFDTTDCTGG